jgi:GNAT superfamily N-acetyltransferase
VWQPQRDAGQGRGADVAAADGGGIDVRELTPDEVERVDARLPLSRLDHVQTYLVAWIDDEPIGHAHLAWLGTETGEPEVQDVFVLEERRRQGVATALMAHAEAATAARGYQQLSIGYGSENEAARRLYTRLGYRDAGLPPKRVKGTILIRGRPVEVDDTLVFLVKDLPVDFARSRSS